MRNQKRLLALSFVSLLLFPGLCLYWTIYDIVGDSNRWNGTPIPAGNVEGSSDISPATESFESLDFGGFDNETGRSFDGRLIVPNLIHYIRFNKTTFTFVDYVCLRSAYIQQKPERIYLHTNVDVNNLTGRYWKWIQSEPDLYRRIVIQPIELPSEIFGQPLSDGWRLYHGSDIARIRTMMKYGGIYLDNDVYVVQNLDKYRKYEIAMGWDEGQFLGSQVIIAHHDARFLPLWLDTYQQYHADLWYYNAGERPTTEILHRQPELMHRVKWRFGVHMLMQDLYDSMEWPDWRLNQDTIHLLINHRSYLDPHFKEYPDFNDRNIQHYPYMFGQLARLVLPKRPSSATVRRYWNSTTVALDGIVNGQRSPDPTHD
ncbi:Uncharacterized protein APZ42_015162 [Daphnia magna]|uniref:Sulfotransferase sult n=1 Tax=Daphnia magna TaxID=35525 RepID=A0A162P8L8_9CRUS|nr:Uncharacterized protein APZ42_015162 [Daphnia magna]